MLYLCPTADFFCFTNPCFMLIVSSSKLFSHATTSSHFFMKTYSYKNHPFQRKPSNLHTRMAPSSCSKETKQFTYKDGIPVTRIVLLLYFVGGTKPATLETGAVVTVPSFVNVVDDILVDSRTGQYMNRA